MKLFIDSADTVEIKRCLRAAPFNSISGITTNPTLVRKSGSNALKEILSGGQQDISIEIVGETVDDYLQAAGKLLKSYEDLSVICNPTEQITIKVPCTMPALKACSAITEECGVRVNVTLVFNVEQAIMATLAGATYISPFIGRMEDAGLDGIQLIKDISDVYDQNLGNTQILAASIRNTAQVGKAFAAGADIVTVPPNIFLELANDPLTTAGIAKFNEDNEATSD